MIIHDRFSRPLADIPPHEWADEIVALEEFLSHKPERGEFENDDQWRAMLKSRRTLAGRLGGLKQKQAAAYRRGVDTEMVFDVLAREANMLDAIGQVRNDSLPLDETIATVDPAAHRKKLNRLYNQYMQVYERGLKHKDIKIAIKCADVLRGMHLGGIGAGQPAEDVRNNELMVLNVLPDITRGPTVGELRAREQERELEESYEDDDDSFEREDDDGDAE